MKDYEDDDFDECSSLSSTFSNLYIVRVFKEYGIMYGLLFLFFVLCYTIIFLPATAVYLFRGLVLIINFISRGNFDVMVCCWIFLGMSLLGILAVWIAGKICDKKYGKIEE